MKPARLCEEHPTRCSLSSPTATSPSTIIAWWPMLGCSCRLLWPAIWDWASWWTAMFTWAALLAVPTRRQDADPGGVKRWRAATALRRVLRTGGTAQTLGCSQGAIHPGDVPAQLPVGPRPPIGSAASCWHGPGRLGPDLATRHSPSTWIRRSARHGLAKEGARDHGYTGKRGYHPLLAVAAGTGDVLMARLREGRANTARAAHFLQRWGGCATPGPGDNSRCGPTAASTPTPSSPPAAGWSPPSPSASTPACAVSSRPYPSRTGRPSPTGWRAPPLGRNQSLPEQARRRAGAAHRPAREAHARFPVGPLRHLQLSRLHHRPGGGNPGTGGRPSAPRRSRTPSETSSTAWG